MLSLDPLWRSFLNFVHTRGGCRGKGIDWNPKDTVFNEATDGYSGEKRAREERDLKAAMVRLKALILETHVGDGFEFSEGESEEDPTTFGRPILCEAE